MCATFPIKRTSVECEWKVAEIYVMAIIEEFNSSSQVKRNVEFCLCVKKYFYIASSENLYTCGWIKVQQQQKKYEQMP